MRRHRSSYVLLSCACVALVWLVACTKKKADDTAQAPAAAESGSETESQADPRLAPDPSESGPGAAAGDAGAGDPHAGLAGSPHGGGAGSPHGGGGGGGTGMGGPGRAPDKTADGRVILGPVTLAVPKSWKEKTPSSSMRAATWTVPGKAGEAELAVFYFGASGAGGAQANLDRWLGQFQQADGSPSADKAKIDKKQIASMPVTTVEVTGRYVAEMRPGGGEKHDKPDYMMLAAIVETSAGPYYYKLVGPKGTITAARKDFQGFIASQKPAEKK